MGLWYTDHSLCDESVYPARIPFQAFPFEINPYQLWGVGVAENMEDAVADERSRSYGVDNLTLAGNLVFDVDEASLVPGQNMDIFPGKTSVVSLG